MKVGEHGGTLYYRITSRKDLIDLSIRHWCHGIYHCSQDEFPYLVELRPDIRYSNFYQVKVYTEDDVWDMQSDKEFKFDDWKADWYFNMMYDTGTKSHD